VKGVVRWFRRAPAWARAWRARRSGVRTGAGLRLGASVSIARGVANGSRGTVVLGDSCELCQGVVLQAWGGSITLGRNVFVGEYTVIYGHGGVTVGDDTLIAMHCRIVSSNHTIPGRGEKIRDRADVLLPTVIGRDVWLGAGVTVLGGVTIGDGCVVAAGSVVTRDLPPYAVAVGVPARVVRVRD
jgi:acetyltransferase-like isoleucine patch superfamily enzyme